MPGVSCGTAGRCSWETAVGFVYMAALTSGAMETRIGSVDGGEVVRVALPDNVTRVRYDKRGYLVLGQNGALMAQQIDPG